MSLPATRVMPIVTATFSEIRRAWLVALPGGFELPARDQFEVEEIVAKHGCGASSRYENPNATFIRPNTAADAGSA